MCWISGSPFVPLSLSFFSLWGETKSYGIMNSAHTHTHTQAKPDAKSCMHILHTHSGIKRCHNWRKVRSYPYPIKNLLEHSQTFLRPPEELSFRVTMSHFCCPGLWAKTLQGSTTLLVWTCQTFPDTVLHSRSPWRSSTACITPQQRPAIGPSWLLSLYISLDGHSSSPSRRTNLSEQAPFRGWRGPDCPGLTHFQESKQKQNRSCSLNTNKFIYMSVPKGRATAQNIKEERQRVIKTVSRSA